MHQSFFRPNFIFNNDAYFLDFRAQKFPLISYMYYIWRYVSVNMAKLAETCPTPFLFKYLWFGDIEEGIH